MGSFASRGTHRVGNAVMAAAKGGARRHDGGRPPRSWKSTPPTSTPTGAATSTSRARRTARSPPRTSPSPRSSSRARRYRDAASFWCRYPRSIPRPARCRPPPATRTPAWSPRSRSTTRPARSRWCAWTARMNSGRALNPRLGRAAARRRRVDGDQPRAV
jgi:hypothetical protein